MKAAALRGALSDRARAGRVHVVTGLVDSDTPSTKSALTALRAVTQAAAVLLVVERSDDLTWKSLRNATEVAAEAHASGRGVAEIVLERGLMSASQLAEVLRPEVLTRPQPIPTLPANATTAHAA